MATVSKRRNRYVLDFYDHQGQRRWQTMPKGATWKQAKEKLREIEDSIAKGVYLTSKQVPTFKTIAEAWLDYKKAGVRASTLSSYRLHIEKHFKTVESHKVNRITIAVVERFISGQRESGMSLANLRKVLITFRQVMQYAVRHRYVDFNPVKDAEKPKRHQGGEKPFSMQILKPDQIWCLLEKIDDPRHHMLILLAVPQRCINFGVFGLF